MPSIDIRRMIGGLVNQEGVAASGHLTVSQRAAGANMTVDVAAGTAYITDDHAGGGGVYCAAWSAVENVAVGAADPSNPRVDRVVVRIRDAFLGDATNAIDLYIVAGTPTAGATLSNLSGAAAVPGSCLLLANVLVGAAVTSLADAVIGNVVAVAASPTPAGATIPYAGSAAPSGWLLCDGSAVSRTTYATLFTAIGTNYGVGNGTTTFNIPDVQGRVPVGKGSHADVNTLGNNDGVALANRRPKHNHPNGLTLPTHAHSHALTLPNHAHTLPVISAPVGGTDSNLLDGYTGTPFSLNTGNPTTSPAITGSVGNNSTSPAIDGTIGPAGTNPIDSPAYQVFNYIIKT